MRLLAPFAALILCAAALPAVDMTQDAAVDTTQEEPSYGLSPAWTVGPNWPVRAKRDELARRANIVVTFFDNADQSGGGSSLGALTASVQSRFPVCWATCRVLSCRSRCMLQPQWRLERSSFCASSPFRIYVRVLQELELSASCRM
jgi:hypothetical protein